MIVTGVVAVIRVPPLADVYHPANVYPVLVGSGSGPYFEPFVTVFSVWVTDPPFASNLIL